MKKGIILIGPDKSGKTHTSHQIISLLNEDEVLIIDGSYKFNSEKITTNRKLTKKTKLIVIDDVNSIQKIGAILPLLYYGFEVNIKMKTPFQINPLFMIVCDSKISLTEMTGLCSAFAERFNVFNCVNLSL